MLSQKLQDDLMTAYQKVYEEKKGHAAGSDDTEKQASQLASDVRYKAKKKVPAGASKEEKRKIFLSILASSPASAVVKSMAKQKLLGESIDPVIGVKNSGTPIMKDGTYRMHKTHSKSSTPIGIADKKEAIKTTKKVVKGGLDAAKKVAKAVKGGFKKLEKFANEEKIIEMRFDDGKEGTAKRLKALAKKRKLPMSKMKNHPQFKDDVKEGSAYGIYKGDGKVKIGQAPRKQKGAMAYDGPNKERSEAADRVLAKTAAKRAKMKEEFVDEMAAPVKKPPKEKKMSLSVLDNIRKTNTGAGSQYEQVVHEKMDPVGQEDGDINNDGKKDGTDTYLASRRKAIGKAIAKKRGRVKEGFSAWRVDLDFNEQVKK